MNQHSKFIQYFSQKYIHRIYGCEIFAKCNFETMRLLIEGGGFLRPGPY